MGFFRDLFDRHVRRGSSEVEVMLNPLLAARLQHFVCIHDTPDWPFLRHYFQFLTKSSSIHTIRGYSYERTAYRKQGEDSYSLLNDRSPWWTSISFLLDLGQRLPANT